MLTGNDDFSGILLTTDYDGTLGSEGSVAKPNVEAIQYFMENGGLFTICTGRDGRWLTDGHLPIIPNTYACCMNGGMIYDCRNETIISSDVFECDYLGLLDELEKNMSLSKIDIVSEKIRIGYNVKFPDEKKFVLGLIDSPVYKLVVYKDKPSDDYVPETARRICNNRFSVLSNSRSCFEINPLGITKGYAVRRIRKLTGSKLLASAGDCDGDISMLQEADVGFAVNNAIPELKKVATHIVCDASKGAFPEIIEILGMYARKMKSGENI